MKDVLGAIAVALTFIAFVPYILTVLRGETKPHVFSWVIWGLTTSVAFAAQLSDGGGAGAWPNAVSGALTFYIAYLAYRLRHTITITRSDMVFFGMALCSLPLWFFTENPFWAVMVLAITDTLGFIPTFRKAYISPYDEKLLFFALIVLRDITAMAALEHYSGTTVLFPAVIITSCSAFVVITFLRRIALKSHG